MSLNQISAILVFALLAFPDLASAQGLDLLSPNLRLFETPFGFRTRNAGNELAPFERSDGGNRTSINGNSSLGSQTVSALGNAISVEIDGSGNTVIITAEQINHGDQNASLTLGEVLNGDLHFE